MDREEILSRPLEAVFNDGEVERAEEKLRSELRQSRPSEGFLLRLISVPSLSLNLDALYESDLLIDPTLTRNRRVGRNFTVAFRLGEQSPQFKTDPEKGQFLVAGKEGIFQLFVYGIGEIVFKAPLNEFLEEEKKSEKPLSGEALLEHTISVFRLLAAMVDQVALWEGVIPQRTVWLATLALFGLQGWSLWPYSPSSQGIWYRRHLTPRYFPDPDFVGRPVRFGGLEIREEPDRCGFRLVRQLYSAFGYRLDEMPPEFDQKAGRLILPE